MLVARTRRLLLLSFAQISHLCYHVLTSPNPTSGGQLELKHILNQAFLLTQHAQLICYSWNQSLF